MLYKHTSLVVLATLLLLTTGCESTRQTSVIDHLPPTEPVAYAIGSTWRWQRDGIEITSEITRTNGEFLTYQQSSGCAYVRHKDLFAPEIHFLNCGGNSNEFKILATAGSIWPLAVGKRKSWTFESKVSGPRTRLTRTCTVDSQQRVSVPAGDFDTYKVVCKSRVRNKTNYYAPSINSIVLIDVDTYGIARNRFELVSASIVEP